MALFSEEDLMEELLTFEEDLITGFDEEDVPDLDEMLLLFVLEFVEDPLVRDALLHLTNPSSLDQVFDGLENGLSLLH